MSTFSGGALQGSTPQQRDNLFALLIQLLESVEIPPSEYDQMETHYRAVSKHLEGCAFLASLGLDIYPQGSIVLGTTVRPLGRDEFDLDFVAELRYCDETTHSPQEIYTAILNRLRESEMYKSKVELMNRCVRLTYAHQFHMDITPAAKRMRVNTTGLVVPDRERRCWVITNPKEYCKWFLGVAAMDIQYQELVLKSEGRHLMTSAVAATPLPEHNSPKRLLQHAVRLMKRHRDMYKQRYREFADSAPISVIITTLAARSYADVVAAAVTGVRFESSFDLLLQVVEGMTRHIVKPEVNGRVQYVICNPSEPNENFADKWNKPGNEQLSATFYKWHQLLVEDLTRLASTLGSDEIRRQLTNSLGQDGVAKVFDQRIHDRTLDRLNNVAVVSSAACVTPTPIPRQSFHAGGDVAATVLPPTHLTLRQQLKQLRQHWPDGEATMTDERTVTWRGVLQPTPLARYYEIGVVYRLGEQPRVHVLSPSLAALADGRRIPHLYNQQTFHLCLFDPSSTEWTPAHTVAATVLPWAMLWLEYFEDWLITHQWRGGGHDPGLDAHGFTRFLLR